MEAETRLLEKSFTPDWVLFTDENLVVVNKPAGLRSVPDGYDPSLPHLRSGLEPILGRLWMVHRWVDGPGSGCELPPRAQSPIPGT